MCGIVTRQKLVMFVAIPIVKLMINVMVWSNGSEIRYGIGR